ncbi:MAG: thiamine-phosphate kinase [Deltaproteobacteria bacterium]
MKSEIGLIQDIRRVPIQGDSAVVLGIGDDCAVIRPPAGMLQLVSIDALVENVHFNLGWHPPFLLGRKVASVNISDIAAMAGNPRFAFLAAALTPQTEEVWIASFLDGFRQVLAEHNVLLLGGDTVKSPGPLMFTVTVLGEVTEKEICYRSGARSGDLILSTGPLGGAAAGLAACKAGLMKDESFAAVVKCHLDPLPQVALGRLLGRSGAVHAMLDSSDGLAADVSHICEESRCGAVIEEEMLPIGSATIALARELDLEPLQFAVSGGEDYQLLFTTGEKEAAGLLDLCEKELGLRPVVIGRIVEGEGVVLVGKDGDKTNITFKGFDHFVP